MAFIARIPADKKMLGVCLGFQALAIHAGYKLKNLPNVLHGATKQVVFNKDKLLYQNIQEPLETGHYHSWVINSQGSPDTLDICAYFDNIPASFQVKGKPWFAVQYHPESILTPQGKNILENWLEYR